MKENGTHEGCIEQIQRLFKDRLYLENGIPVDEEGRIRIDDWELNPEIQAKVADLWKIATTENLSEIGDLLGYRTDFHNLFGFGFTNVDYSKDANEMTLIKSI